MHKQTFGYLEDRDEDNKDAEFEDDSIDNDDVSI